MRIPLSPRLLCCAGFVEKNDRVADVGTDHGYLGLWLLQQGIARSVIASDIAPGPLSAARNNAEKFGFSDKMEFYLSDGAKNIPRDFDVLVCAGMGGDTMVSILDAAPWLQDGKYRLVLQCQSKTPLLRAWLSDHGWRIAKESILRDGKFLYTVLEASFDPAAPRLTPGECYISPALLAHPGPELTEYCGRIVDGLRLAVAHKADAEKQAVLAELEQLGI